MHSRRQALVIVAVLGLIFSALNLLWEPHSGIRNSAPLSAKEVFVNEREDLSYYGTNDGSHHDRKLVDVDGMYASTNIVAHAYGNTIFERLYILKGVFYIVTDTPELVPELHYITSKGLPLAENNDPTEEHIRVISRRNASSLFHNRPLRLSGTSFIITDHPQFVAHYYHFSAEILLSLWRTYTSLDPHIPLSGYTSLSIPQRLILPHASFSEWRDSPGMNPFISRAAFSPSLTTLYSPDWADLSDTGNAFVLDRTVMWDRAAAGYGPESRRENKPVAEALSLPGGVNWWRPVRNSVVEFVGVPRAEVSAPSARPVVTYISRQGGGRRRLTDTDHSALVAALESLSHSLNFELHILRMESIDKAAQIRLAARTNIMMGVHGNGLTAMLWMNPTRPAAVFEFFAVGGFIRDYEITAKAVGLEYHGFWNDTHFVHPGVHSKDVPDFQGDSISIHAPTVTQLISEILASKKILA